MKSKMLIGFIVAVVIIGGGAFYGGMLYGKSQGAKIRNLAFNSQRQVGFGGQAGQGAQAGQANRAVKGGANFVSGDIIAKDGDSITVKDQNGGSKIIFLSDSTQISKFTAGGAFDLNVGQTVTVNGTTNSDGSITAQMIQLRPPQPGNAISTPLKE